MERVWNVTAFPLVLDWSKPATQPGYSAWVNDDEALELASGPDWSLENPRQPQKRQAGENTPETEE